MTCIGFMNSLSYYYYFGNKSGKVYSNLEFKKNWLHWRSSGTYLCYTWMRIGSL